MKSVILTVILLIATQASFAQNADVQAKMNTLLQKGDMLTRVHIDSKSKLLDIHGNSFSFKIPYMNVTTRFLENKADHSGNVFIECTEGKKCIIQETVLDGSKAGTPQAMFSFHSKDDAHEFIDLVEQLKKGVQ